MAKTKGFSLLLLTVFVISCTDHNNKIKGADTNHEIDTYLTKAVELHNIPGLALAVVDKNTMFRICSATKLITATGVFQLIQEGKLSLEDKYQTY